MVLPLSFRPNSEYQITSPFTRVGATLSTVPKIRPGVFAAGSRYFIQLQVAQEGTSSTFTAGFVLETLLGPTAGTCFLGGGTTGVAFADSAQPYCKYCASKFQSPG